MLKFMVKNKYQYWESNLINLFLSFFSKLEKLVLKITTCLFVITIPIH